MAHRIVEAGVHLAVAVLLPLAIAACGDGSSGTDTPEMMIAPLAVAVSPSASQLTTRQPLTVAIAVSGGDRAGANAGSVVLTSGAYSSGAVAVTAGKATITIPAGVLAEGTDSLVARFTPTVAGASAVTGTATVTIGAAQAVAVTATSSSVATNGHPFQATPIGSNLFVTVTANGDAGSVTGIRVYDMSSGRPIFRCTQPLDSSIVSAQGFAVAPDGRSLAVAGEDAGLNLVTMAEAAARCTSTNILVPQGSMQSGQGSFGVAFSKDGQFAFVANEYGSVASNSAGRPIRGNVGVVALSRDAGGQVTGGRLVGQFSTGGQAIANVTISPDGTRLYVTSEITSAGTSFAGSANAVLTHSDCSQGNSAAQANGLLSIIDVAKAESNPAPSAIIATVAAGCSPVRVVETADNQVIWVAARGDNRVLAFSTRMLESNPENALLGYADTGGVAPVGLQLFRGDTLLAVANSNRFASPSSVGNMTILTATPVRPVVVQTVAASFFPRSLSVGSDDATLYLTDYSGGRVQIVATR